MHLDLKQDRLMLGTCGSGTDLYDFLQHFWNRKLENPCTHLAVIPVLNGIVFLTSPIYSLHEEGEKGLSIKGLCSMKIFWVVMLMMTCAVCGFSVGIMWPGTFSIASASIRGGGTAMFALACSCRRPWLLRWSDTCRFCI